MPKEEKNKEITFIEAVVRISKSKILSLCYDKKELEGSYPSICVYSNEGFYNDRGGFVGKLRWVGYNGRKKAEVDDVVINAIIRTEKKMQEVNK